MYDTDLVCENNHTIMRYDSRVRNMDQWKYCPICKTKLSKKGYSPNI